MCSQESTLPFQPLDGDYPEVGTNHLAHFPFSNHFLDSTTRSSTPLFWHEKMIYNISHEIGHLEDYEISKTHARIRVLLNGLEPIPQDTIVDFDSGEEALVNFEFEGMENFCSACRSLLHLRKDCPVFPQNESYKTLKQTINTVNSNSLGRHYSSRNKTGEAIRKADKHIEARRQSPSRRSYHQRLDRHGNPFGERISQASTYVKPPRNKIAPPQREHREEQTHRGKPQTHLTSQSHRGTSPRATLQPHKNPSTSQFYWREKSQNFRSPIRNTPPSLRGLEHQEEGQRGEERTPIPPLGRNLHDCDFPPLLTIPTTEEMMQELHDVTLQYINCGDPTECATRRQRVLQGDAEGQVEEVAANIIAAATAAAESVNKSPQQNIQDTSTAASAPIQRNDSLAGPSNPQNRRDRPPLNRKPSPGYRKTTGAAASKRLRTLTNATSTRSSGQTPNRSNAARTTPRPSPAANRRVTRSSPDFHTQNHPLP